MQAIIYIISFFIFVWLWSDYGFIAAFIIFSIGTGVLIGIALLIASKKQKTDRVAAFLREEREKEAEAIEREKEAEAKARAEEELQLRENERISKGEQLKIDIEDSIEAIVDLIDDNYKIYPCSRCNDIYYSLLSLNSVGNALQLNCENCEKKTWFKSINDAPSDELSGLYRERSEMLIRLRTLSMMYNNNKPVQIVANSEYKKAPSERRRSIPKQVKQEVWQRDNGKCVECGSQEKLEYDHIIPVVKGGANTARNIQLLCEPCNRTKSAKIQ